MKYVIILFSLLVSAASSAQLKVYHDGNVGIGRTSSTSLHKLNIGEGGISQSGYDIPLYSKNTKGDKSFLIGIEGNSTSGNYLSSGRSFGVRGIAGGATNGWNFGVVGALSDSKNGAGIFGTIHSHTGVKMSQQYAGYFDGPTHVAGNLVVTGGITGTILSKGATQSISNSRIFKTKSHEETTVSDRLAGISMFSYYKSQPAEARRSMMTEGDTIAIESPLSIIAEQDLSKQHYALAMEQLEEAFPDLVYEEEDGAKAINYIEMIPLLVQSLNELNIRLAVAEENAASLSRMAAGVSSSPSITTTTITPTLKQNTPNPFTECTTIRFSLPSDAQNAYIYIFDMTGKMQKSIPVDSSMDSIIVNGYELSAGMYIYSLVVDGKEIDSKRMILTK